MANYRAHTSFNLFIAFPITILLLFYFFSVEIRHLAIFSSAFIYGTLFMSPDMDLAHQIRPLSLRGFFAFPFLPYSYFFRHRGLSHSVIFGSLTRVLWLLVLGVFLFFLYYKVPPHLSSFIWFFEQYHTELSFAFGGIFSADFSHLVLDRRFF